MPTSRYFAEVTLPGAVIGLSSGLLLGGAVAIGGLPLWSVILNTLALGIPLAVLGAGYDLLLASGRMRLGGVVPAALYWLPGFPLSMLLREIIVNLGAGEGVALSESLLPFLAYNALLSVGYAIGFLWLHENLASLWWPRIRDHNPVAARYVGQYTSQAVTMQKQKEQRKESKGSGAKSKNE